jgi:hypothetical protein
MPRAHSPGRRSGGQAHNVGRSGRLKQRNVFRVAVLYLVVCWLILDPVHVVFHMLDVPIWADRLVIMLMAAGFPAVVIFAWVYEITPEGLKPTVEVPHGQSIRKLRNTRITGACYGSCCRCDRSSAVRELGEPHANSAGGGPP